MPADLGMLLLAAVAVSFLHTLAGPDHYLPFIALSKSRNWTLSRTLFWTLVCGSGHVASSVLLGLGGAALGWSVSKLTGLQAVRGTLAGWLLLGFGLMYALWGFLRAKRNKSHRHFDVYPDHSVYVYEHRHGQPVAPADRHAVTPWVMFLIFLLGPCEPMIPLLYLPAAQASWWGMALLIVTYAFFTLAAMVLMVLLGYFGISLLSTEKLERHMHTLAGFTLFTCGAGIVFFNW